MSDEKRVPDDQTTAEAAAAIPAAEPVALPEEGGPERVYTEAEVKEKLDALGEEWKDRHLRTLAEYENFRRRVQREKEQWTADAVERFATDLLAVLDDFDRALATRSDSAEVVLEGVRLTDKKLRGVLAKHGVEVVDPLGSRFDPKLHEAMQRAPADAKNPAGNVVQVFDKGYLLRGKLLRPARVMVAGE